MYARRSYYDLIIVYLAKNQGVLISKNAVDIARLKTILRSFLEGSKLRIK